MGRVKKGTTAQMRFDAKFRKTETCWLWTSTIDSGGYGNFYLDGRQIRASRVAWQFFRGPIPDGMCVLHRCDVRPCVNPEHLFLGTLSDNMKDCAAKGRLNSQHDNTGSKLTQRARSGLTPDDVRSIRAATCEREVRLAERYRVGRKVIYRIRKRISWADLV